MAWFIDKGISNYLKRVNKDKWADTIVGFLLGLLIAGLFLRH